jgi:hypothetical protein
LIIRTNAIAASGAACATLVATGTASDFIRQHLLARFQTGHLIGGCGFGQFSVRD